MKIIIDFDEKKNKVNFTNECDPKTALQLLLTACQNIVTESMTVISKSKIAKPTIGESIKVNNPNLN